jgi:hypothetical protein
MKRLFAITGVMLLLMGAATAFAECPTAQSLCAFWPPLIVGSEGTPTHWCTGFDCFDMNYAEEGKLVAGDDEGPYPRMWHSWISGVMSNVSCDKLDYLGAKKNVGHIRIKLPDALHCTVKVETDDHLYLWFFASIPYPDASCLGWAECQIY